MPRLKTGVVKAGVALCLLAAPGTMLSQTREAGDVRKESSLALPVRPDVSVPQAQPDRNVPQPDLTAMHPFLGPGDLIEVSVFDSPELTEKARIDNQGKIKLPLIGEVAAGGMSVDELRSAIEEKLVTGRFVKHPQASIFVLEYLPQVAYVSGEVMRPGAYALLRSRRLRDMLTVSGGLTGRAGNEVTIKRGGDSPQTILVDLSNPDEEQSNPVVLMGDNITVGQTGVVYVLGDVGRPGGFLIDRRSTLSVVQALALAEGATPSAALTKARLIRVNQQAHDDIPINLKAILKSQSPDLRLQGGDILFVPGSLTRGLGRKSLDTLLATAGGVAVYASIP